MARVAGRETLSGAVSVAMPSKEGAVAPPAMTCFWLERAFRTFWAEEVFWPRPNWCRPVPKSSR